MAEWFDKLGDPDLAAHATAKGWDKIEDPTEALTKVLGSHREAEKFFGTPKENLLKIPAPNAGPDEVKAFWSRLGAPGSAEGYDLSDIKHAGDVALDPDFATFLKQTGANLNLPASAVKALAAEFVKMADTAEAEEAKTTQGALAAAKAQLDQEWGGAGSPAHVMNTALAQRAAESLGVTAEELNALEATKGYPAVMNLFLKLGRATGEAGNFTGKADNAGGGQAPPMDLQSAMARREALMTDKEWANKFINGDFAAGQEMNDLISVILAAGGRIGGKA